MWSRKEYGMPFTEIHPIRRSVALMTILTYQSVSTIQQILHVYILSMLFRARRNTRSYAATNAQKDDDEEDDDDDDDDDDLDDEEYWDDVSDFDDARPLQMNRFSSSVRCLRSLRSWTQSLTALRFAFFERNKSRTETAEEINRINTCPFLKAIVLALSHYTDVDAKTSSAQQVTERDVDSTGEHTHVKKTFLLFYFSA
jgi:hypothetical protein